MQHQCVYFPDYSTGCQNTTLIYGWVKPHFSHTSVSALCNCFSPGFLHKPSFFHLISIDDFCWRKCRQGGIASSACSQESFLCCFCPLRQNPCGRRPWALCRSCCSLQVSSLQHCGDPGRALGQPCRQNWPMLRTAPSHCKAPQPEPRSSPVTVQAGENTSERPQIWVSHMKVKKGRNLVSLSAIPMAKNKPLQSRNWCTTKPGKISFFPQEVGREQSMNQNWFSCCPYEAEQAWAIAWSALQLSLTPFPSWL